MSIVSGKDTCQSGERLAAEGREPAERPPTPEETGPPQKVPRTALTQPPQHPTAAQALPGSRSRGDRIPGNFPVKEPSFRILFAATRPLPAQAHSSPTPTPGIAAPQVAVDVPVFNILVTERGLLPLESICSWGRVAAEGHSLGSWLDTHSEDRQEGREDSVEPSHTGQLAGRG